MMSRDHALWLLVSGTLFYTLLLILVCYFLPANDKLYGVISGLLIGFSSALFMYLKMPPPPPPPVAP